MKVLTSIFIALFFSLTVLTSYASEEPRLVSVVEVQNRPLSPKVNVIGSVHSRQSAELTSGVDGRIEWVQEAGTNVKEGEVVARLEKTRLLLAKEKQQAQIQHSKVSHQRLIREFNRLKALRKSQHVSEAQIDEAQSQRDLAKANLTLAKVRLKEINDELNRTDVKAPFSGIITQRYHQKGEDIGRAKAIVAITDPEHLEIRLHAPLKHSKRVRVGDVLKVYHSEGEFSASIRSLIPVSDVRSQTFEIRLNLPLGIEDNFSVGELISLALPIAPQTLTTLVPRDAVVLRSKGAFVFKINEQDKAIKVKVELGDGDGDWIAVKGDIYNKDRVVIRGAETLQDGQLVNAKVERKQST
ncbi:efflux RND transporter periplasmic adaptor subunit [Parashewanella curva]|uniref:Efflux RND transporter periplasmic adaptor subunit n=1 Tax=Parashewanella curva TaxID=2338552 RepID=A0A3L8PY69_9GAMM|nr:efflux RND transporter periplasmic adaptor subunit [Parashewanella curva]RLV59759.1 efflux RND transporter periplasmic adaptor subunit [Parashewanella curva]